MHTIEALREQETALIDCAIFAKNQKYKKAERVYLDALTQIRIKIKQFYETTILD